MAVIDDYKKLLSSQPENKRLYETIEITHTGLTQDYFFVRDSEDLLVTDPAVGGGVFTAANIENANSLSNNTDLDQTASFTISDVNNILNDELDNIDIGNTEIPLLKYRVYHSDTLSTPAEGPIEYEIESISQKKGVFTIKTSVPKLNERGTGIAYNLTDFPLLRGTL